MARMCSSQLGSGSELPRVTIKGLVYASSIKELVVMKIHSRPPSIRIDLRYQPLLLLGDLLIWSFDLRPLGGVHLEAGVGGIELISFQTNTFYDLA
jgi:hypothetical protein